MNSTDSPKGKTNKQTTTLIKSVWEINPDGHRLRSLGDSYCFRECSGWGGRSTIFQAQVCLGHCQTTGSYCSEVALESLVSSPICLPTQLCQAWQLLTAASLELHVIRGRTFCSVHLNTVGSNSAHVPHAHQPQIQDFGGQNSFKLGISKQTQKHECTGKGRAFEHLGSPRPC